MFFFGNLENRLNRQKHCKIQGIDFFEFLKKCELFTTAQNEQLS